MKRVRQVISTVDDYAGAGYIYLQKIGKGEAAKQIEVPGDNVILDFNKEGVLIGIEFLSLATMPERFRS